MAAIPSASAKIFTYWEHSKRLSAREVEVEERLINSCLANWRLVNQDREVVVITPENVGQHVKKPLPANWDVLAATVRSVFVRVNVIREQGGWWMDASALHFRPLDAATVTDPMADWCGCHLDKQHLNRPVDWFFFRPPPEVPISEVGEKGYTSQLLFNRWAEEVDMILKWDPNEWAAELRALYPHLTFHALPYYFDGWAMWKMFQQLLQEAGAIKKGEAHLDIPSNNGVFRMHTICNLEAAYSYLWEGGPSGMSDYLAKFPESHESSRPLDPVTFGMLGGNDSTAEIVPIDDKNMIWKNLFERDAEDFLEENPNCFCAKFTNVHRGMLLGLFDERRADEVNKNSLVGKYVPGWRNLFRVHPTGVGGG